eukprot:CAMPEP_0195283628 /NCGR_PEP_ID=MMETSP0707-20130614/2102_1 /TAXON_ID=33640 /ORGANISM="Asterionellopsis glacialis, Strain CCMP134" /LENGTH=293 /DNA_ID=CAMNT_0040342819 /DNA_START=116 /DNA_END=997 /DNA_ORIENTATION=-
MKHVDNEIHSIRQELEELRAAVKDRRNLHTAEKYTIEKRCKEAEYAFKIANKGFNEKQGHFAYLQYARKSRENEAFLVPPTILSFEAQLCRSVHQMCVMKKQLNLASQHSVALAKALQKGLDRVTDNFSSAEIHMMNKIMEKDADYIAISKTMRSELQRVQDETSKIDLALSRAEKERIHNKEMSNVDSELAEIESSCSSFNESYRSVSQISIPGCLSPAPVDETEEDLSTASVSSNDIKFDRLLEVVGEIEPEQLKKDMGCSMRKKLENPTFAISWNNRIPLKMKSTVPLSA